MRRSNKVCSKSGITVIGLVISIVVMLILAGVTINLILGENGIFTTAQIAVSNFVDAQEKEQEELSNFESTLSNMLSGGEELLNGVWSAKNKVNKPKLANSGLTPVTINANGTYGVPNIEEDSWYSYDGITNKWANAITKDGSMWVWIPRFAYKINYTNTDDKSVGGTIDVVFLQGTTDNYYDKAGVLKTAQRVTATNPTVDTTADYTVHPAFTNETSLNYANGGWDKEIPGFWMAKFEAGYVGEAGNAETAKDSGVAYSTIDRYDVYTSTTEQIENYYYGTRTVDTIIKCPTFQANRPSMNYIGVADAYELCRNLQNVDGVYGLSNADSHMTKNSEWGAVAYLAHSKYGRNGEEVVLNNVSLDGINTVYAVTGYGATATNSNALTTTWDKIQNGTQAGSWLTEQGQTASTTGNIYGIYDLSGGLKEMTAGYIASGNVYKTYAGNLKGESTKYKVKYAYAGSASNSYNAEENQKMIGEGIVETSNQSDGDDLTWFEEASRFPYEASWVTCRSGAYNYKGAGIFCLGRHNGATYEDVGFRAVIIVE